MDQQIWQWTLTKEAVAPCFVRDVLSMREHANKDGDFFWLGHTPCRTVLLVGMVVAIQVYEKRTIYTIDDGTAVIDCILRHPPPVPKPRSPPLPNGGQRNFIPKCPSPKNPRLNKTKLEMLEPPPAITEAGYPVRVVGRVVRHYDSKQVHADKIDPCPSSLDEIAHLEHVVELHKTKYSLAVPFVPPYKPTTHTDMSTANANKDADVNIFSNNTSCPAQRTTDYSLAPPPMPIPLHTRNKPPSIPVHLHFTHHDHTHIPTSPTASSVASSTPSSPCKPSSPAQMHEHTSKLRHPSRLHTHDLTANTFRLYVKHYMDNAPLSSPTTSSSPSRSTCRVLTTPTKRARDEDVVDEPTPRPRRNTRNEREETASDDGPTLGFTLSHIRRVPELALLAARVVRAEVRRREKANREKERTSSQSRKLSTSSASARLNGRKDPDVTLAVDPPRKKIKRLFCWAVIKLHEEGSIVLWDGDVRPLPVPPPPTFECGSNSTFGDPSVLRSYAPGDLSTISAASASVLYSSSASVSLYSHYHPPRRPAKRSSVSERGDGKVDDVDADADPGSVSDPGADEEAYVPLTPRFLAGFVREAIVELRRGRAGATPTAEDIIKYLRRKDSRWAKVGLWTVEEALAVVRAG